MEHPGQRLHYRFTWLQLATGKRPASVLVDMRRPQADQYLLVCVGDRCNGNLQVGFPGNRHKLSYGTRH